MTDQNWETNLLNQADYYKKVLLDGCIIKKYDVEMCDLRFFFRSRSRGRYDLEKPRIQIYKANKGSKEVIEQYHNYNEAFSRFNSLTKKR
ncbi:MAG: hypothetical protein DWQ49_11075 [Bacteroidetes bacterium]|jgi:hypothetical protein|nr:MAG: hypothetical protein DWQ49_11075 [Bacteroidota bacterium]